MTHLNFETVGNPQHPSVMLLHGFMSSNAQWLANIDALSGSHHKRTYRNLPTAETCN